MLVLSDQAMYDKTFNYLHMKQMIGELQFIVVTWARVICLICPRAAGIHIRQIMSAHVTNIM